MVIISILSKLRLSLLFLFANVYNGVLKRVQSTILVRMAAKRVLLVILVKKLRKQIERLVILDGSFFVNAKISHKTANYCAGQGFFAFSLVEALRSPSKIALQVVNE